MKILSVGAALAIGVAMAAGSVAAQQATGGHYGNYGGAGLDWLTPLAISSYEWPFKHGAVAVVAPTHGGMATYTLVPCQNGAAVCAGGQIGSVTVDGLTTVVSGLYGRTFYLGMGGHGIIEANGIQSVLAWDSRVDGPIK